MPKFNPFQELKDMGLPAPKGVLQVGASFGQEMVYFEENGIIAGVFIEPLMEPYQALSQSCMKIPGFVAVNALCSDESGQKVSFHVASNGGQSSSMLKPQNHLTEFNFVSFDQVVEMSTHRLDHIVAFLRENGQAAVCDKLDLLYMDTQGAELKVLRGAGTILDNFNYVLTEVTRNQMYAGSPSLADLMAFLAPQGFTLNNVNFSWHHHADALFVRNSLLGIN